MIFCYALEGSFCAHLPSILNIKLNWDNICYLPNNLYTIVSDGWKIKNSPFKNKDGVNGGLDTASTRVIFFFYIYMVSFVF